MYKILENIKMFDMWVVVWYNVLNTNYATYYAFTTSSAMKHMLLLMDSYYLFGFLTVERT